MFFYDWTYLILIPAVLLSMYAQYNVTATFRKYNKCYARCGLTGKEAARQILDNSRGLSGVPVKAVSGELTDHYDPKDRSLSLSESVYGSTSIAAIGVAAHEVGHAMQHEQGYTLLALRNSIVPVVNITSQASAPIFFLGFVMGARPVMNLGILLFSGMLAFHIVTLPVEFDASRRALNVLAERGMLETDELKGVYKVLRAAAMTYIAATAMTALHLVRLIILRNSRSDRD